MIKRNSCSDAAILLTHCSYYKIARLGYEILGIIAILLSNNRAGRNAQIFLEVTPCQNWNASIASPSTEGRTKRNSWIPSQKQLRNVEIRLNQTCTNLFTPLNGFATKKSLFLYDGNLELLWTVQVSLQPPEITLMLFIAVLMRLLIREAVRNRINSLLWNALRCFAGRT